MISGEMAVVNIPKQIESIFITAIAERAPKNTAIRGF